MPFISPGGPGKSMYVVSPSSTTTPGATPTGLYNTFAPSGNCASRRLASGIVRFTLLKNLSSSFMAS